GKWLNLFTGAVIAIMVMLSIILTASVLYPDITGGQILMILVGGSIVTVVSAIAAAWYRRARRGLCWFVSYNWWAPGTDRSGRRMSHSAMRPASASCKRPLRRASNKTVG